MAAHGRRATLIARDHVITREETTAMHIVILGETQVHLFQAEHEQLEREARRQRQVREARRIAKAAQAEQPAPARGFIPRIAGALGLF
jgi:hypothetical protein